VTLVRVNETDSGSNFLIVNLQLVTKVECRNFGEDQEKHQVRAFLADGGNINLVAQDADRLIAALEDFAGYARL
jgi:hypothetical protein